MSFSVSNTTYVSGAQTVTCASGSAVLLSAVPSLFSGISSVSGATITILDAISGITAATSGRVLWQWSAINQSGVLASVPSLVGVDMQARSGIVATGAANVYLAVSWTQ